MASGDRPEDSFHLRPYRHPADEPAWLDLWGRVAVTSYAWTFLHHAKPRYSREALELVAETPAGLEGFIDVEVEDKPGQLGLGTDSRCGFVWELGVLPARRGRGLGRVLIGTARSWLEARGLRRMEFWSADPQAQEFYRRLGMREIERHWQFRLRLPDELRRKMKSEDGVGLFDAYGHCPLDRLEGIMVTYGVRVSEPEGPRVCVGFEDRW